MHAVIVTEQRCLKVIVHLSRLMLFQSLKQCPPIPYCTDYITTIRSNPVYSITNDDILK